VRLMGPQLDVLLPELDERARRLVLGAVARAAGDGGITAVAKRTGASWQAVANGAAELESGQVAPEGRVRRPGAGRKKLAGTGPGLVPALLALVEDSARGGSGVAAGLDDQERGTPGRGADRAGAPVQPAVRLAAAA
jgi:hypothetical protein